LVAVVAEPTLSELGAVHVGALPVLFVVNSVVIGANLVKDTVVPFIEYEYSVELEV
jgi:hypothetical protein